MKPLISSRMTLARPKSTIRTSERVDLEVEVDVLSDHNFYTGMAGNISEGGLFVACEEPQPVGTPVHVRFTLPGSKRTIMVTTEVRWISAAPPGMGLRFVRIKPEDLDRVQQFVRSARRPFVIRA